jgi:signal transduction histidine kinase
MNPEGENIRNWLGIPLIIGGKPIGMLTLSKTTPDFFTSGHVQLAEAIVAQVSFAVQNAWLFAQVRAGHERHQSLARRLVEVQESERRYVARELHDETSQALTALIFGLRQLEQDVEHPENIPPRIAELKQIIDRILENLHRLAMDLRPVALDHLGLLPAIEGLVNDTTRRSSLKIHFKTAGLTEEDRLPPDQETAIYRIVQEALTNVARHSSASNVDVILERREGKLIVIVEDDGIGFNTDEIPKSGHLGLLGMQERAEMMDGSLLIESRPGGGTTLVLEVPYAR